MCSSRMKFEQGRGLAEVLSTKTNYSTFYSFEDAGHVLSQYAKDKLWILGQ